MSALEFKKPILIYIPCHNCEKGIAEVLSGIPAAISDKIECLVVDNKSEDRTAEIALSEIKSGKYPFNIRLIRPRVNIGYAGSQKLAYSIALESPAVRHVVMMHGDGQYPPSLLDKFVAKANGEYGLVGAYRDKRVYREREETPGITYLIIRTLSNLENLFMGLRFKEWQNGYVMYSRGFLSKVPLSSLSDDLQIDGELLICADILKEKTLTLPVFKKYKSYEAFSGAPRLKYIMNILRTLWKYRTSSYHRMLLSPKRVVAQFDYEIMA